MIFLKCCQRVGCRGLNGPGVSPQPGGLRTRLVWDHVSRFLEPSHFWAHLCNDIRDVLQFMTFPFVSASVYNCFGYSCTSFLILKMCALFIAIEAGLWIRCLKILGDVLVSFCKALPWIRFPVFLDSEHRIKSRSRIQV